MRLDKFLVDCGVGSRSQVKTFLKKKQVTVNGQVETSPKTQIDEDKDQIAYLGQELTHETFVYYLLNKPQVSFQQRKTLVIRLSSIYSMRQQDISRFFQLVAWILILMVFFY